MYFEVSSITELDAIRENYAVVSWEYDKARQLYCVQVY